MQKLKTELKISDTALTLLLWVKVLFLPTIAFLRKIAAISKIRRVLILEGVFSETMCLYLRSKFQVPRIILTSFRQGVILLPTSPQIEPLKGSPRLGLRKKLYCWFIPFKSNLVWFRKYKWNINCHCAIEKRVAS